MREGWTYKKLGEVGIVVTGSTPSTKDEANYASPDYSFIKPSDLPSKGIAVIDESEFHISSKAFSSARQLPKGSVVVSCIGIIGKVGILNKDACTNQQINAIIPNDTILPKCLAYIICNNKRELEQIANAPIVPIINKSEFSKFSIPVPPLSEQQSIVAELDKINELISLKKAQLSDLDSLAQSIFYDMFGDPIENEKGWEVKKLGEVVDITAKLVDPNQEPYCNQFHVGPANIIGGTGEIVDCLIAKDENLISGKYAFKSGAVLYSKIRPNLNKVAIPSFDGVCSADMYPLSIKTNAVNMYIMRLLMTKEFLKYAVNCSGRARMPKINREALFEFKFCLPPLSLQQEFAKRIELIELQKAQISSTIKDLETLLASRMQYWFD